MWNTTNKTQKGMEMYIIIIVTLNLYPVVYLDTSVLGKL